MVLIRSNTINLAFEPYDQDDAAIEGHPQAYAPAEFMDYGFDILESEELTNSVYEFYLSMMAKVYEARVMRHGLTISDVGMFFQHGIYMPCVQRTSFTREIDLYSDGLPDTICVANLIHWYKLQNDMRGYMVRRIKRLPHGLVLPPGMIAKYRLVMMKPEANERIDVQDGYFGVTKQGHVHTPKYVDYVDASMINIRGLIECISSIVMNASADSKYLWLARCEEDVGVSRKLKLLLGLDPEHIKSLFYARKLPVTETGRKRPILHWVRAHKRRIKEGVEIDISRHLRGIETFEMDSLRFEILQPTKPAVALAQITRRN